MRQSSPPPFLFCHTYARNDSRQQSVQILHLICWVLLIQLWLQEMSDKGGGRRELLRQWQRWMQMRVVVAVAMPVPEVRLVERAGVAEVVVRACYCVCWVAVIWFDAALWYLASLW